MTSLRVRVRTTPGLLEIDPKELEFPFILNEENSVFLHLFNISENYVAFKMNTVSTNQNKYFALPDTRIMEPHSFTDVIVTMEARKDAPPDMQHKDIIVVTCALVNKDITANSVNETEGHNDAQPQSLVREELEEGSSPRDSVPDNDTVNPSKYKTVGESLLQAIRHQHGRSTRPNCDRQERPSQPQSPVLEGLEEGSSPRDSIPDNDTVNPSKYKTVGESLMQAIRHQRGTSTRPNRDWQERPSQDMKD